jgi:NAD(P)-dependent dehydrogenase (short-subunit alcohol dehydrogenase family)
MKNVVITGAARGIGFALVQRAIARGDRVFAMVRKQSDAVKFGTHEHLYVIEMNVASTCSVEQGFVEVDRLLAGKQLDAVINAAAVSQPGAIELTPVSEFEEALNTNALGSLRVIQASIPRLRGHGGRAIMISSLCGHVSSAMLAAYCMSKHAVESLVDCARRETDGMGMHVIAVEPGVIQTDMYKDQGPQVQALIDAMSPEQRRTYEPLYTRYLNLVGGPAGEGAEGEGISVEQCAIDIEQALFDPEPKPRYQSGEDAREMIALSKQLSDIEMDAVLKG